LRFKINFAITSTIKASALQTSVLTLRALLPCAVCEAGLFAIQNQHHDYQHYKSLRATNERVDLAIFAPLRGLRSRPHCVSKSTSRFRIEPLKSLAIKIFSNKNVEFPMLTCLSSVHRNEPLKNDHMSRTRYTYFASNNQPKLVINSLLKAPQTQALILRLSAKPLTLKEAVVAEGDLAVLRKLQQVNVIRAYTIGGVTRYRIRKLPPYVREVLAA